MPVRSYDADPGLRTGQVVSVMCLVAVWILLQRAEHSVPETRVALDYGRSYGAALASWLIIPQCPHSCRW